MHFMTELSLKQALCKSDFLRGRRFSRGLCTVADEKLNVKETVFLPKTDFPARVKSTERARLDTELSSTFNFSSLYEWQRNANERTQLPEFVLLDGPPYANGSLHVGHAVNKIIKDFVVKSRISAGHRVRFQPGWDCHGLPIELAVRKSQEKQDPLVVRQKCAEHAQKFIDQQANLFKRWGITADWNKPYITMSLDYVQRQLELFARLYSSGVIYREFRPVYWSPSSHTALAESELEYNHQHKSLAAFFQFRLINLDASSLNIQLDAASSKKPNQLYALIWTTTPWNLPMNNAILYNEHLPYCIVRLPTDKGKPFNKFYIVCSDTVESLQKIFEQPIEIVSNFDASQFNGLFYRCVHHNELALPFLKSADVTNKAGTGLVHASFAHGFDDYKVALENNHKLECFVDEDGCYDRNLGPQLYGKSVLEDGNKLVLEMYKKHVIHASEYIHSYPYDWRTKKPIIVRSSKQWFVDLSKVAHACVDELKAKNIKVQTGSHDQTLPLVSQIKNRPNWCISRQRTWGVPIPAILNQTTDEVLTSADFIKNTGFLFAESGCNSWWEKDVDYFLNDQVKESLNLTGIDTKELAKTTDVMDVWMDSGFAWSTLSGNQVADLVIEGHDQFRGWFQSLMVTSMLSRNVAPFKQVLVHGFTVDENGRKMSKSLGNVVDPQMITDGNLSQNALGVDGLRLWVAMYGCENAGDIKLGPSTIKDLEQRIHQLRILLRFILGSLKDYKGERPNSLSLLDQFMLASFDKLNGRLRNYYADFRFRAVINELLQFIHNPLSSIYVNLIRDRLYCDRFGSESHIQAQFTVDVIGIGLVKLLAPILPHLSVEFVQYHPQLKLELSNAMQQLLTFPDIPYDLLTSSKEAKEAVEFTQKLRSMLTENSDKKLDFPKAAVQIEYDKENEELLRQLQSEQESVSSQLVELLGVSSVRVQPGSQLTIQAIKPTRGFCIRCRKHNCPDGLRCCQRCTDVMSKI